MKKYLLIVILIVTSAGLKAQVRFGLKAGTNASTAKAITYHGQLLDVNYGFGFHAGVELKVNVDHQFNFAPQLQYAHKTFAIKYNTIDTNLNTLRMHYLELPVLFEWKKSLYTSGFFVQFGPSFSLALGGNQTIEGKTGGSEDKPIVIGPTAYGLAEANLLLNIGYQFGKNFQVTTGYAHGLGNIIDDDDGPSIKPRMFTLSIHYWLH